jgi:hypothetical protein
MEAPSLPLEVCCRACGYDFTYSPEDVEVVEDVVYGNLWKSIRCKNRAVKCMGIIVLDSEPHAPLKCCCKCVIL